MLKTKFEMTRLCSSCGKDYQEGSNGDADNVDCSYVKDECCADCLAIIYAENINLAELIEAENGYREV